MTTIQFNDPRCVAASRIHSWLADGLFVAPELQQGVEPLVREIVMGVIRRKNQMDYFVDELTSKRPNNRLLSFLYVGLYQIFFTDGIPDHAAVHETVNAASRSTKKSEGLSMRYCVKPFGNAASSTTPAVGTATDSLGASPYASFRLESRLW